MLTRLIKVLLPAVDTATLSPIMDQLRGGYYLDTLRECAAEIDDEIEVNFCQPKPVVKVTGEFWAQTTEGDGNFRIFEYLETQGAEVVSEPLMTWINYLCDVALCRFEERKGLGGQDIARGGWNLTERICGEWMHWKGRTKMRLAVKILNREYDRIRKALGGVPHPQVSQAEFRRLAQPFFDCRIAGGEGHLEIAKTLYYGLQKMAHMVLSVKPFGCLPSTQSDGAQAAVLSRYPEINYVAVETSGEGDINAYSRVQMGLAEARDACAEEFAACLAQTGYAIEDIQAYCAAHRDLSRPLQHVPRQAGVCGRAAQFVLHVASRMDRDPAWRAERQAGSSRADALA
jgi:predicted nucleotide-binding protein (sugar kinase/HSP70/actin superfamily)